MKTRETGTEGHNITKDIDKKVIRTTGHSNPKKRKMNLDIRLFTKINSIWCTWKKTSITLKKKVTDTFSSGQFSRSVVSDSLWPHELQHARPPCPSPTPGVHSNSCPLSWWCHPAISSSVVPFSSRTQSLPALGSFPMSQLFAWGGQSTRVSALVSFLPKKS